MVGADIRELKQAATPFLSDLAERVGFRPSRVKNKFHCCDHADKSPSCHLYGWGIKRFCCGDSLDAIDLAKRATDGTFAGGSRELEYLTGVQLERRQPQAGASSQANLARAELFRVGYLWWLEEQLSALKTAWLADEDAPEGEQIKPVTARLSEVKTWSAHHSVRFLQTFEPGRVAFVAHCVNEARTAQNELADAIAGGRTAVAA
jgi:hypothetical protein